MTRSEQYQLSAEVGVHWRTVERWCTGHPTSPATEYALKAACERLGIDPPGWVKTPQAPTSAEDSACTQ